MAISSDISKVTYAGNNSTSTAYAITFAFGTKEHIAVDVFAANGTKTALVVDTDFSVTGGNGSTGSLTTTVAYDSTYTIRVSLNQPLDQPFVFNEGNRLPMKTVEAAYDWIVRQVLTLKRIGDNNESRSVRLPDGETLPPLPPAATRASKVEKWSDDGTAKELLDADDVFSGNISAAAASAQVALGYAMVAGQNAIVAQSFKNSASNSADAAAEAAQSLNNSAVLLRASGDFLKLRAIPA
jgi:hypothetical protein